MLTFEQLAPTLVGVTASGIWALLAQRGRNAFDKQQAADQRIAQQALETMKANLTFEAEVRRQAAVKKAEVLFRIAATMTAAVESVYTVSTDDPQARKDAVEGYWRALREGLFLFGGEAVKELKAFGGILTNGRIARDGMGHSGAQSMVGAMVEGEAARDKLLDVIRRELGFARDKERGP
jgi:hypothetical protein